MEVGRLYFIKDEFYDRFEKYGLLSNRGEGHNRPCCYMFKIHKEDNVFWMIPVSSQVEKYEKIYAHAVERYGVCDNIEFGYVLGKKNAFLPQNMFPVTIEYIDKEYLDPNTGKPITMSRDFIAKLNAKARKKVRYDFYGKHLGFSDTVGIYEELTRNS